MALSADQLVLLAEAVRESYATVTSLASGLNSAQESLISDDLDTWESIRDSYVRFKETSGVDFDNERKRAGIFYRLRAMLGLPYIMFDQNGDMLQLFELEVGSNFG